ncbi:T cell receptor alpha variable 13-1 [Lemmus lemmus]
MKTLSGPFVLCLWLQLNCVSRGEQLEQQPYLLSVQEGGSAFINCTYTATAPSFFSWYKQEPGAGLQFLLNILSNVDRKEEQGLTVLLNKKDKHLSLNITAAHLGNSATYFCASRVRGIKVEQSPSALSLQEGTSSGLTCNFSTTMRNVQWLWQNSRGSLINLFYLAPGTKQNGRLNSTFNSKEGKSTLHIRDAQLEDSGTYFCAAVTQCFQQTCSLAPNCVWVCSLQPCHRQTLQEDLYSWLSQGEQVEQRPSTLRVQEGTRAVINCTYEDSGSFYFPWYKQEPGKDPKLIIDIRSNVERKQDQRLIILHDKKAKLFSLHITDTQPEDSAVYFCAASTHCSPDTCSLS